MLFAGVGSKLVPVIVTEVPMGPLIGVKLVIEGGGTYRFVFWKTETELPVWFNTTNSGLPSPVTSPEVTANGLAPAAKSTKAENEAELILPGVLAFLLTETALPR